MRIDYTNLFSNCALYLPALNVPYATMAQSGRFSREQPVTPQDLNFLSPANALFFYPWALYSAGQAAQRSGVPALDIVATRDRRLTKVIGDSGGYQILSGVMPFHGEDTTRRMLKWLESNTDYSAVLDFPTGTIASGGMMQHVTRLEAEGHDLAAMSVRNGFSRDFNACLTQTLLNNDLFVREATPGATKFLNVIHGRNEEESSAWFKAVCHYPFQGWAFAGGHRENLSLMLRRLIQMRDMKLLENAEWIHVLGVTKINLACMYTIIQRCIRAKVNPNVQFSFDSANPSHAARTFNAFTTCRLGDGNWTMQTVNIGGDELIGSKVLLIDYLAETVFEKWRRDGQGAEHIIGTGISRKITLGDVCVSQKNSAAWEGESPLLVMNHNIQAVVEAMRTAYRLFDENDLLGVPTQMKTMRAVIEEVFSTGNPFDMIEQCRPWLDGYNTRI